MGENIADNGGIKESFKVRKEYKLVLAFGNKTRCWTHKALGGEQCCRKSFVFV